jgi:hypothetical protein
LSARPVCNRRVERAVVWRACYGTKVPMASLLAETHIISLQFASYILNALSHAHILAWHPPLVLPSQSLLRPFQPTGPLGQTDLQKTPPKHSTPTITTTETAEMPLTHTATEDFAVLAADG